MIFVDEYEDEYKLYVCIKEVKVFKVNDKILFINVFVPEFINIEPMVNYYVSKEGYKFSNIEFNNYFKTLHEFRNDRINKILN